MPITDILFPGQITAENTTLTEDVRTFFKTYKDGVKVRIAFDPETVVMLMGIVVFALLGAYVIKKLT